MAEMVLIELDLGRIARNFTAADRSGREYTAADVVVIVKAWGLLRRHAQHLGRS